jgi:hypothetical protein
MELTCLQFPTTLDLKKFRETLPPRRVVIMLGDNKILSEFSGKELELAETFEAILLQAETGAGLCWQ